MPFATSIQSLAGPHAGNPTQVAVDWTRNNVFNSGGANTVSMGILTGIEQAWVSDSIYTFPSGSLGDHTIGVDGNGNPYITWFASTGGGLIQIDGTTLAQLAVGGSNSGPPAGFILIGGEIVNIPFGATQYMLINTEGAGAYRYYAVMNEVTYAGLYGSFGPGVTVESAAILSPGKSGTDIGFVVSGPQTGSDTQLMVIQKIRCSVPSTAVLSTFVPTDINGSWSEIFPVGVCTDQTDGNILIWCQNGGGGATSAAVIKVDASTGAILWNTSVPVNNNAYIQQFSFNSILHQSLALITFSFGTTTVTTINTATGSSSSTTTGFNGVAVNGHFCYNDTLGAFVLDVNFLQVAGGPALLNSTPSSFDNWAVLYANPAFVPPSIVTRRFLAEAGPIRVIQ